MTPAGIEPATFRFVAQHLNHCATAVPVSYIYIYIYAGYTQKNGAVSKVNKKFISHLTRAQHTPSAAAIVQVSRALITILQCVHPGSHNTHRHDNQIHPRLGVTYPL